MESGRAYDCFHVDGVPPGLETTLDPRIDAYEGDGALEQGVLVLSSEIGGVFVIPFPPTALFALPAFASPASAGRRSAG